MICLSETFSNSTVPITDGNIPINGCSLLRAGHLKNIKRGGVCIYFKGSLLLIKRNNLTNLKYCFVTKVSVNNEKCFFTCFYWSPCQNPDELEQFCTNFYLLLSSINNLHLTCPILIGDFNVKCSKWYASNNNNNAAGIELDSITLSSGYSQIIDKPTHFVNGSSPCIDLIFSSNVSLTKKNIMTPFYGWGSTASRLEPL